MSGALSVVGLGKLGFPMLAAFASKGFSVTGYDIDAGKMEALTDKKAPFHEPGLGELLRGNGSRIQAARSYVEVVSSSDVTFLVVPTPSGDNGGFLLRYVLEAAREIGKALREKNAYHLVVLTSTVMPGSTEKEVLPVLEAESGKKCGRDFGLCYNPEFIALGSVIRDFLNPDLVLIGESDPEAGRILEGLYAKVCDNKPSMKRMSFVNAELTKLSINTFVTTKITFANTLARICENLPGADVDVVTSALGCDSRIGAKYLKGAVGYGGPCFPRDNAALAALSRGVGAMAHLPEATDSFNREQVPFLVRRIRQHLNPGGVVGILGLSYKPHSDVVEESQGLLLAQVLAAEGVKVVAYDPAAMENAKQALKEAVGFTASAEECVRQSDVAIIVTPWEEFKKLSGMKDLGRRNPPRVLIDCWRMLADAPPEGVRYERLGMGPAGS